MRARAPPPLPLLYLSSPQNLPALGPRQPRPGLSHSYGCHSLKGLVACRGSALSPPVADRLLAASTLETNDRRLRKRSRRLPRTPQDSSQRPFLQPMTAVSRGGLLDLSTIDIWGQVVLCCGAVPRAVGCLAATLAFTHRCQYSSP